jgi:Zn-dependent protease
MFGWSINLFRIRGIMISLHSSFLLLLAYVCYDGWQSAGAQGLWWSAAIFLAFFVCVVLHELGHSFTAMRFGIGVRRILLMPIGGMAQFERIPRKPSEELLITLAGPSVNFVIAGVLWLALRLVASESTLTDAAGILLEANLFMGLFNLLPAFPMDGGRILRAILATRTSYLKATYRAMIVGRIVAPVSLAAIFLFFQTSRVEYVLLPILFLFILAAGTAEYRMVERQEAAEARWKEALRLHLEGLEAREPPVLGP